MKINKKFLGFAFLLVGSMLWAQVKTVTGTVTDSKGNPQGDAVVTVQGTGIKVYTDANGQFTVQAEKGQTINVESLDEQTNSFVVGDRATYTVSVKPAAGQKAGVTDIDEVVVTAMGITREKRSLGYASQSVNAEKLTQAANSSLATALQGKTSGLDIVPSSGMPGASALITIRGVRSFTGDNTPLYVVDGMPISSASPLNTGNSVTGSDIANRAIDIDPNNIASINVLKGQAAAALYGMKASNGVLIITTKNGQGLAKGKPQITFNSNVSFDRVSKFPDLQTTYAQGSGGAYSPTASTSWGAKISDLPKDPNYGGETVNNYTKTGMHPGQYYVPQRANAGLDPWAEPKVYNNAKDFFLTGVTLNNTLGIAQSFNDASYALSLGNTNQEGIVQGTGMNRVSASLAASAKLSDHWKTQFNGYFSTSSIDKMTGANDGIVAAVWPAPPSYDLKGIPNHYLGNEYKPNNYRGGGFTNPYWSTSHNSFTEKNNRFFGNANVTYSTKLRENIDLDVKYQIGTDIFTSNYQDIWSYGMPGKGSAGNGSIEENSWTNTTLNSLLLATVRVGITENINLTAIYGNEIINQDEKRIYAYGADFAFSGFNHISNTINKDADERTYKTRTFGNFVDLNIDYRKMLYLELTGRADRVSYMPNGSRTYFYPSTSFGFVFTELGTLKNSALNYGKVRLSYAQVGQGDRYLQNYYAVPNYGGGFYLMTPILYPIGGQNAYMPYAIIYNPNLKPQNTVSYEAGLDLEFFKNLISLSYTYSRQNVDDQIFTIPISGSTGVEYLMTNGGNLHTNAHEATLTIRPLRTANMSWDLGFNFTKYESYVDELAPGVESIMLGGFVTPQVRAGIGYSYPVIYGSSYQRDEQGRVVVDANGFPIAGAPSIIGKVTPDFILGFNTSFRYKFVTLSAVLEWKNGGQMYGGTSGLMDLYGVSKASAEARDNNSIIFPNSVYEDGTPNTTPITGYKNIQNYYTAVNNIDESSIIDNSFVKLREIALRFDILKNSKISLGLTLFARNILLWTNSPFFDPESSQGNNNMSGAFERFSLPQTTSYGAGVNFQF
jgi:TonB-linked SusC/RagA family outer membrane protein